MSASQRRCQQQLLQSINKCITYQLQSFPTITDRKGGLAPCYSALQPFISLVPRHNCLWSSSISNQTLISSQYDQWHTHGRILSPHLLQHSIGQQAGMSGLDEPIACVSSSTLTESGLDRKVIQHVVMQVWPQMPRQTRGNLCRMQGRHHSPLKLQCRCVVEAVTYWTSADICGSLLTSCVPLQAFHDAGWTREAVWNIPNAISMARLISGPFVAYFIINEYWATALGTLAVAGASDWADGYAAKHWGQSSVLGSYLDPLADKVLVCCTVGALAQQVGPAPCQPVNLQSDE